MTPQERAEQQIVNTLTTALLHAWARHPGTPAGQSGTPSDVYFSVEKAVEVLAPVVLTQLSTLQQLEEPPIPPPGQATFCADHKVACDWICPSCVEGHVESTLQQQRQQMEDYVQHKPGCEFLNNGRRWEPHYKRGRWRPTGWYGAWIEDATAKYACACGLLALLSPDRSPSPDKEQNT